MRRLWQLIFLIPSAQALYAQGTKPRDSAAVYQAHVEAGTLAGTVAIGADLVGHIFAIGNGAYKSGNCIAIEAAFFAPGTHGSNFA